jgi:hypothetical protein
MPVQPVLLKYEYNDFSPAWESLDAVRRVPLGLMHALFPDTRRLFATDLIFFRAALKGEPLAT